MIPKIPIIILTKDEPRFLELMVKSIFNRTSYPFKLFIVDNCSISLAQKDVIERLCSEYDITVFHNKKNNWVLGFNLAISSIRNDESITQDYYVLSDGDLIVPIPQDGFCWLEYLKIKLEKNVVVGKIGLSLDITRIKNHKEFYNTCHTELRYMNGPKLDGLIISPVDTTIAIYRANLFVFKDFKMLPGHASLVKPYYYTARTPYQYRSKHLGWLKYHGDISKKQLDDKVVCFTKFAAYVDPILIRKCSTRIRLFYRLIKPIYKAYWALITSYYWIVYFCKKFTRSLNEIQFHLR